MVANYEFFTSVDIRRHSEDEKLQALFFRSDYNHLPKFLLGGIGKGGIPEPIPNSEVKPFIADGTTHKSVGE